MRNQGQTLHITSLIDIPPGYWFVTCGHDFMHVYTDKDFWERYEAFPPPAPLLIDATESSVNANPWSDS
jgi:hypothetical protein